MAREKFFPDRLPVALGCGFDPVPFENGSDDTAGHLMPQMGQSALNASITPFPILLCQANHQSFDLADDAWPPWFTLDTAVVLLCNQFSMPS